MRTKGFCLALVAVAAVQVLVAAQRQAVSAEQEVFAVDDERTDALRHGDPQPLERVYADDYTLVTGRGEIRSKADQIAELKSGQLRYAKIDVVDRKARLYGDVAVIVSRQSAVILQGGREITSGDERVTRVYKKIEGAWRVIATHATPIR
jgi:uncharacterized protein (TIGR02246 family)